MTSSQCGTLIVSSSMLHADTLSTEGTARGQMLSRCSVSSSTLHMMLPGALQEKAVSAASHFQVSSDVDDCRYISPALVLVLAATHACALHERMPDSLSAMLAHLQPWHLCFKFRH